MDNNEVKDIIKFLLDSFKLERYVYITVTVLSFIFLLICGTVILLSKQNYELVIGMFGSSGVIAYSCSQLLRMWKNSIDFATSVLSKKGADA